ncbi:MAG: hypothetical protein A2806_00990 [Candidatus Terrybacteria bacterium RIFCSPHIGHO2_01_FULL_48_17]|uniref:Uncharacterized protein n=1 Tax=Candidatus Terrybacteria bacterium RIFCSPHIGHO2_01_FULL_48_17 TaxID=1802362 RepID=A0A1G2PK31_9BACT|nr:MAG: hypothetical protein A2806_00990 [Candidatus Terrybacteria bacterium RIFCSPHIGHO2_01_FULL_48_17]OHA51891.1 MAG: hypothetical protein A3A30_01005 [Candidatus Terrybacteria bacterium RIFCSPLOWO2_01_FULL_48_14]
MIKKRKGKYVVVSETTGRKFGSYPTLKEAKHHLAQIEYFKRLKHSPRPQKQLRKKGLVKKK